MSMFEYMCVFVCYVCIYIESDYVYYKIFVFAVCLFVCVCVCVCVHVCVYQQTNSQHKERPDNRGSSHVAEEKACVHEGQQTVANLQGISHVSYSFLVKTAWILRLQA